MRHGLPLHFDNGKPLLPAPAKATPALLKVKRAADVMLSIAALLALSPVMLFIATLIKATSSGPILFTQNREGLNGEMFRMYKFRTLHWAVSDLSGVNAVTAGDPRLTPVGAVFRRTSIDELPQLINIILGDMSLVGPRPHVPGMLVGENRYDEVVPYYSLRHRMKPGLTGWAQVNGLRGVVETRQSAKARVDHDLAYIANYSVLLDIEILLWTIWQEVVRLGRGP
ncbi:sugar transferase [Devosia sp. MC532]|uniref:sugar transferase n=1 Tax=Devosia sp. MC532 TaxID=2799788 RepID=UPI0018F5C9E1|nr:sugar transferase [Devosia sp. MC532]MBJ7577629.1 sugar transferase [Devosia sp. MC532]